MDIDSGDIAQRKRRWPKVLVFILVGLVIAGPVWFGVARIHRDAVDQQIAKDLGALAIEKLSSLPDTHEVTQVYGRFKRLSNVRHYRPEDKWRQDTWPRIYATAHFEKGQALLHIPISRADSPNVGGFKLDPPPDKRWTFKEVKWRDNRAYFSEGIAERHISVTGWAGHPGDR